MVLSREDNIREGPERRLGNHFHRATGLLQEWDIEGPYQLGEDWDRPTVLETGEAEKTLEPTVGSIFFPSKATRDV